MLLIDMGISLVISKPFCPVYNFGTINKVKFGTSNKMDLFPCRLSNLLHQRIYSPVHVATKPMLKHHRVYSSYASKDVTGSGSEAPKVSSTAVLRDLGIIAMGLPKIFEVLQYFLTKAGIEGLPKSIAVLGLLKSIAGYCILLQAAAAAEGFLANNLCVFSVLQEEPFSTGDYIKVGDAEGQVIEMGLETTSILCTDGGRIDLPTSWFYGKVIVNESRAITVVPYSFINNKSISVRPRVPPWHLMVSKIYLERADADKLFKIVEEIRNMMKSNSNVYLEEKQPSCGINCITETYCELTLECHLKQAASEAEVYLAKQDVLLQSAEIIKKHGAKLGGHKGEYSVCNSLDPQTNTAN